VDRAQRFGLDTQASADVADLVRLHLLLTDSAIHEDLDSEDVILGIAERISRRNLVPMLHVLTVADALSTGPAAWGPWQEALVDTLVSRVDAALSEGVDGAGLAKHGEEVRRAVLSKLSDEASRDALDFVRTAPLRYLASREPAQVAMHAQLVAALEARPGASLARLSVSPCAPPGAFEVAIAAHDRPELFARITGALTLSGLDILGADAYTTDKHIALDVFTVRSATLAAVGHETWQRAERYLQASLSDRLELETRLAHRRRHYPSGRPRVGTHVRVDTSAGYDTAVLVTASDRVGLLYDIARAITSVGLDIRWAKVLTVDGVARDTFHVAGADGQAPTDAGVLGHVSMRIREGV
jgi:[protein-PII] uridylyltransferase